MKFFKERLFEKNPRKGSKQPKFLQHRFPIKNGFTYNEVIVASNWSLSILPMIRVKGKV